MAVGVGAQPERELRMETTAVRSTSKRVRSKVTNGRRTFVNGDGRSPWARRWRDLIEAHARDISPNGVDHLSEAQRSLIKRAATIEIQLEAIEGNLSEGLQANLAHYAQTAGHLKRILETLGIERRQKGALNLGDLRRLDLDRQRELEREQTP
jgi:hypothetical protein